MKKFMTVLLVIAVMFTFSFGSAFAAPTADEAGMAAVLEQQEDMAEAVNDYAATVVYNQKGYLVTPAVDANLNKAAVDAAVAELIAAYNQLILEAEINAVQDNTFDAADEAAVKAAWYTDLGTAAGIEAELFADVTDGALYTTAVSAAKAAFAAKVDAVDPSVYVDEAGVKTIVSTAKSALQNPVNNKAGLQALVSAEGTFDTAMKAQATVVEQGENLAEVKADAIKAVQEAADAYYEAEKASLEAIIEANADPASVAQATADLAVLAGNVEKVEALYVSRIEAVEITETVNYTAAVSAINTQKATAISVMNDAGIAAVIAQYADVDLLVKFAETLVSAKKNEYSTTTGLATYNAATLDKALAEIIEKIESLDGSANTYGAIGTLVAAIPTAADEKAALESEVTAGVAAITTGAYAATNWADENQDAVEAIQEDYEAKIEAAKTADEIDELVKAAKKAMDAYLTAAEETAVKNAVEAEIIAEDVDDALAAYAAGVAAKDAANVYSAATQTAAVNKAIELIVDAALALQDDGLTTKEIEDIIDANYAAALAVIDGMKSDAALKAEKEAVEAAIKALPTTATLENKAEFMAAYEQLEAYEDNAGAVAPANKAILTAQVAKIVGLEKAAVEKMIRELPKTITLADKAAVEAAEAAAEAYAETYEAVVGYAAPSNLGDLAADKIALANAMKTEAAKLIAALPEDITAEDKEAVEAARAAYDALYEDDKVVFDNASEALVAKLIAAEEALAEATAYTDVDAQAYVQDLKIVARSVKTAKGNVKVTINADVEELIANGYTVEYKFYRSEKARAKYGTAKKVSESNVYTNTAGKKGVQYFYKAKLVVKNAEGEVVATTPLTQCKYATRVWSK